MKDPSILSGWGNVESDPVLDERYTEALDGIEEYSHVQVLFWIDGPQPQPMEGHVQRREELPMVGVFAGHGPGHPNPIGLTTVPILRRERNVLTVRGLDALDATSILDIKPYPAAFDRVENPRAPDWSHQIYEREDYF